MAILVNRAPVLTLWAAVVAERLGHDHAAALTLGKAVAGLSAQAKGRRLGIYHETTEEKPRARATLQFMGRRIAVVRGKSGLRATRDGRPESPESVEKYLESKLGSSLAAVRAAMEALARSLPKDELDERAFELYEHFRPRVKSGEKGWGQKGELDLGRLRALAREK